MSNTLAARCTATARRGRSSRALLLASVAFTATAGGALGQDIEILDTFGSAYTAVIPATLPNKTYIMLNGGFLTLGGPYSTGDATFDVRDGSLSLYNDSDAGTSDIALGASGTLSFFNSASAAEASITMSSGSRASFSQLATGSMAQVVMEGAAMLDLSGLDGTTFTLGSLAGSGGVVDLRGVTLELGRNNDSTTFAGTIGKAGEIATGGLTKLGSGTLTLSGSNRYSGQTRVEAGRLLVNGNNSASDVVVAANATLGGTGRIGALDLFGIVAPGPALPGVGGTLTVDGNAIFRKGSTYVADFAPKRHDLLAVAGTVKVEGGTIRVVALDPGRNYSTAQTEQIIVAGAITGADKFKLDLGSDLLYGTLVGTGNSLSVRLIQSGSFESVATPGKNQEAAKALTEITLKTGAQGLKNELLTMSKKEINDTYTALVTTPDAAKQNAPTPSPVAGKIGVLAPTAETKKIASTKSTQVASYFADPLNAGVVAIDDVELVPVTAQIWSVWLAPTGAHGAADTGPSTVTWWSGGLQGGVETTIGQGEADLTAGLLAGYQRTGLSSRLPDTFIDQSGATLGAYGTWLEGGTSLSASLAETLQTIKSRRDLSIGTIEYAASASYLQYVTSLSLEAAHTLELGNDFAVTPLAGFDASWSYHNSYTETGAGPVGLVVDPLGEWRVDAGVGLAVAKSFRGETGTLTASASAKYQQTLVDGAPTQTMRFVGGTTTMEVEKPAGDVARGVVGLGLAYADDGGLRTALSYAGSFSANSQAHAVSASIGAAF